MSVNKVWGKTPNVIEQRLMVALYNAKQAMTYAQILDLAQALGLMNVSMNLLALKDKGLVKISAEQYTLTPAGMALTKVGLEHDLFATPGELSDLVKLAPPPPPEPPTAVPPAPPKVFHSTEEKAAQRLWETETTRAESKRLAESPRLSAVLTHSPAPPVDSPAKVTPLRAVCVAVSTPASAPAPGPLLVLPVVEQPKPKPVVSAPKSVPKPSIRRAPPPPPPRFRK